MKDKLVVKLREETQRYIHYNNLIGYVRRNPNNNNDTYPVSCKFATIFNGRHQSELADKEENIIILNDI